MCRSKRSTEILRSSAGDSHLTATASSSTQFSTSVPSSSSSTSTRTLPTLSFIKGSSSLILYSYQEIRAANGNFLSKPFSSSSSSTSWLCHLHDREVICFRRKLLRHGAMEPSELRSRLSSLSLSHHSSLVRLLGASSSGSYVYLVYEYIRGGVNLANCLRNPKNPNYTVLSTWISRMQVATDVADGLDYIHSHSSGCKVHNHIKSSSIIVSSESLNGMICHLGAAELCREADGDDGDILAGKKYDRTGDGNMKISGSRGYMAPELRDSGKATKKSDVYAFGIVLLELLSGMESVRYEVEEGDKGYKSVSVAESGRKAMEIKGGLRRWMDRRLNDSYPVEVAEKMVILGLECAGENPNERPDMSSVAGAVSKMFLDSKRWSEQFGMPSAFSVSMAPR